MRSAYRIRKGNSLSAILGLVGFVLVLFTIGAFMEGNTAKMLRFAAGTLVVFLAIIFLTSAPSPDTIGRDCWIDWDGRSNPEVCN